MITVLRSRAIRARNTLREVPAVDASASPLSEAVTKYVPALAMTNWSRLAAVSTVKPEPWLTNSPAVRPLVRLANAVPEATSAMSASVAVNALTDALPAAAANLHEVRAVVCLEG